MYEQSSPLPTQRLKLVYLLSKITTVLLKLLLFQIYSLFVQQTENKTQAAYVKKQGNI